MKCAEKILGFLVKRGTIRRNVTDAGRRKNYGVARYAQTDSCPTAKIERCLTRQILKQRNIFRFMIFQLCPLPRKIDLFRWISSDRVSINIGFIRINY